MLFPYHDPPTRPLDGRFFESLEVDRGLHALTPARGRGARPVIAVAVDDELLWVTPVRTHLLGAARPSSRGTLVHLGLQMATHLALAQGIPLEAVYPDDDLVHAAAEAVAEYLADIPPLPFIGEPFGGEEGTD